MVPDRPTLRVLWVLLRRMVWRDVVRHPVLLALNVGGIALGIAVFLAIQISNRSAVESFRAGVEMVAGRANLEVRGTLDERDFPEIENLPGVRAAAPLVEALLTLPGAPGEYIRLVGLDPFAGRELRTFELLGADRGNLDFEQWLRQPRAVAVTAEFSQRILPRLPALTVATESGSIPLEPRFVIDPDDAAAAGDPRLVAMDIGWAQELLGRPGTLSAILLLVEPEAIDDVTRAIRAVVPADVEVGPPARRSGQVESMLGAFQLNLTALSMVSILVGAFLIYNSVSASVVRRQHEIGMLRALGTSRGLVAGIFVLEGAVSGALGSVLGVVLALPLASALTAPVAETVSSLYIATSIERLFLSPMQIGWAVFIGLGAAIAAAFVPAREAALADPARVLRPGSAQERFRHAPWRWGAVGLAALVTAWALGAGALSLGVPWLGFASAFFVIAGFSLLVPATLRVISAVLEWAPRHVRIAARNVERSAHRNTVTIAALAAAIAMTVSISIMIHSFRGTVDRWISATLVADVFIGSAANEVAAADGVLPPAAVAWIQNHLDVVRVSTFRERMISFRGERTTLAITDGSNPREIQFIEGRAEDVHGRFLEPDHVLISEPFANRFGLRSGDLIDLATPGGEREFIVAGVYQDYARNGGVVMIDRRNFLRHWPDPGIQSVGVTLREDAGVGDFETAFREAFFEDGVFSVYSNPALRARIFEIFDQTFAITMVLRAISVVVAALGVFLAVVILTAERSREIGVLRAIGASRAQIVAQFLREASVIGLLASGVGVASGVCLAMVLTWVVNKAWFGWTIDLGYPVPLLVATPLWIVPVAVAAAAIPALRAARQCPASAIRFE